MIRTVNTLFHAKAASDGDGVKLSRVFSPRHVAQLDPFLLMDEFNSDAASDYIGGFPPHPHRGFETITYMLDGKMLHEDSMGNKGELSAGDVQWMTAASGVIHSEMPQQLEGRMRGFQLWLNLPAAEKMQTPSYRDIPTSEIPRVQIGQSSIKLIAGEIDLEDKLYTGAVKKNATQPLYLDVHIEANASLTLPVPSEKTALIYVYEGDVEVEQQEVLSQQLALLNEGDRVNLKGGNQGTRLLVLAANPLNEKVQHWGPFVMNTRQEIDQAINDYRNGELVKVASA
ncbi:pirin family protein [Pleionea sp. CnH1-48]|nr:pirin family protein [Pleionea sp. CnH1-48]MCO7227064.1 pirin family protein [Pleionea sp. CnH1-48]